MRSFESWVLAYLLNSLWQVPLLYGAGWVAARALRSTGVGVEHRVWVSTLLLQSLLPACSISSSGWMGEVWPWRGHRGMAGGEQVSVAMGPGVGLGVLHLPGDVLLGIATIYGVVLAYFVARLLWRAKTLFGIRRRTMDVLLTGEAAVCWARCCERFGIHDAALAASAEVFGPLTMGLHRRLVLLPAGMVNGLSQADLHTVIAHEFAHMQRRDFVKNLVYELLSLPVSYHPLFWLTRERVIESREMVCDQMAAEVAGPTEYARSLLRLASLLVKGMPVRAPYAIGIFDANMFERRLMKLTEGKKEIRGVWRVAAIAACVAFGVGTCGSALALRMNVDAASVRSDSKESTDKAAALKVSAGVMAGSVLTQPHPVYPESAKQAKIQGAVVLHAIIGKGGLVESLRVISGPDELRRSALDAVRQWTYKPYLLNGEAVEVDTTVTVTYSIGL